MTRPAATVPQERRDRRLTAANGVVAHSSLRGIVAAERYVDGDWQRVAVPLADLSAMPGGARDRQLLMGARFLVLERREGFAFGQVERDGLVGWVAETALSDDAVATHRVRAPASHLYPAPDIKAPASRVLSLGATLTVTGAEGNFVRTDGGAFVPQQHLCAADNREDDPVAVAELLIGTPYLWGGNSRAGIDCSGLVQVSCHCCGIDCPPDSDLQAAALGEELEPDEVPRRGDLLFWRGHVAWVAGPDMLLHANAHHMAVAFEPLAEAVRRIAAQGGGDVTARRRPAPTAR